MNKAKTINSALLTALILFSLFVPVNANTSISIETTLNNGSTILSSKKSFTVTAKDSNGNKADISATINGEKIKQLWSDSDKTSFLISFTKAGKNIINIVAKCGSVKAEKSYTINYKKTSTGEKVGTATVSVELFTLGTGYLVNPTKVDILEGENSAESLIKVLHNSGYVAFYGGSITNGFYLSYIANGSKTNAKYNGYKNTYSDFGSPKNDKEINIKPIVPKVISDKIKSKMSYYDTTEDVNGYLGEFNYSNGSSFMYCLNNDFSNTCFSDNYLSDGDVLRVQFTLCYGADIGGSSATESENQSALFSVANKDKLTSLVASFSSNSSVYNKALNILKKVNASQKEVDYAYKNLKAEIEKNEIVTVKKTVIEGNAVTQVKSTNKVENNIRTTEKINSKKPTESNSKNQSQNLKKTEKKQNTNIENTTYLNDNSNNDSDEKSMNYIIPIIAGIVVLFVLFIIILKLFKRRKHS